MFSDPWFWIVIVIAVSRNVVAALPKPGDSPAAQGFGSNSVGYQFTYRLMQGLSADTAAFGSSFDMRQMRKSPIKSDGTPRIDGEDTIIIPPKKDDK